MATWIQAPLVKVQLWALPNTVMGLSVLKKTGNFFTIWTSQGELCSMEFGVNGSSVLKYDLGCKPSHIWELS